MEILSHVNGIYDRSSFVMQEWQHAQVSLDSDGISFGAGPGLWVLTAGGKF